METIKTNRPVRVDELHTILTELTSVTGTLDLNVGKEPIVAIESVCDGRTPSPLSLCFIEREPTDEIKEILMEAVTITNYQVSERLPECNLFVTNDPRAWFIDVVNHLLSTIGFDCLAVSNGVKSEIDPNAIIHPTAILEEGVVVGENTVISAGCVVKKGSLIGKNVLVRENTVIGCDGIALYKAKDGRVLRFPHLTGIIIDSGVEIGANCVIARGVMKTSRIGKNTVIGNLSNLGHSVHVGKNVWMSVGCLIGGNTVINSRASLGLGVSVKDNITIGRECNVGMGSAMVKNAPDGISFFGNPAKPIRKIKAGPER